MRIACVSDTHNQLDKVMVPDEIDVLVHAGDMLGRGMAAELNGEMRKLVKRFAPRCRHMVLIAGNHDWIWQQNLDYAKSIFAQFAENAKQHGCELHYLQDEAVEIDGLTFYGSPWQPEFFDWAFNLPRNGDELREVYAKVPDWVDVLVTHGPPQGILDKPGGRLGINADGSERRVGCEVLLEALKRIQPRLHVFGHIHGGHGVLVRDKTIYVNASTCNEGYEPNRSAVIVELESRTESPDAAG